MNQRTASAPYFARIGSGSTVLRLDLDIFSTRPVVTGWPLSIWIQSSPSRADLVRAEPAAVACAVGLVGHHALREKTPERLRNIEAAEPLEGAGPEARIEQVQDRMLDAADILRDGQPCLRFGAIERLVRWLTCEADEIPAGIDEGVQRVGLADGFAAAGRASHMLPARVAIERVSGRFKIDIVRKDDRQLIARHRDRAAGSGSE